MAPDSQDYRAFDVPLGEHLLSSLLHRTRRLWRWLGSVESSAMRDQFQTVAIDRPIHVAGLARAGTTILLEMIASHSEVATHRYRDFWSIFTPVWSQRVARRLPRKNEKAVERAHGDGIMITADSPEAMEEMVWMEFFADLHDPTHSNVLNGRTSNRLFETYYRDHIQKLLFARTRSRYASKGNYNVTRMEYLLKLFPDARFVLPVRQPREHVASLRKQHRLLLEAARRHPRSLSYLDRVGHFEFGAHRVPINAGSTETVREILALWEAGEEVRGWARYWAHIYGFLADRLDASPSLRDATLVVRYEDLCCDSQSQLNRLFEHCQLADAGEIVRRYAPRLRRPVYYQPEFSPEEEQAIDEETAAVAERFELPTSVLCEGRGEGQRR